jgi:BarA-like signal transduction histidine kinase
MDACLSKPIDTAQLFSTLSGEIQRVQEEAAEAPEA